MTYCYKKYEFTAFTEADFLGQGGNGRSIGCGDTFTMPGSATVTMSTWDNDSTLSGDRRDRATDNSGQKATVDGARVGSQMYAESYHVLKGSDGKIYYMIEIEVEGYNAPGAGDDFFTFYGQVPPAGVELSVVKTCNVKGCWVDFRCLGAGETAPTNEAPTFTNVPENGILCVDENQSFVIDLAADDADGDTLTYEIVGGADASAFTIDPATGELTFTASPDYEAPTDGNGNNVYDVTVKVSDGKGGEEIKPLWIKVKDVEETTGGGTCIVVEAEDMHLRGYRIQNEDDASGGKLIKGSACKWGVAKTTFDGPEGTYDLKLSVLDENDGQGRICVNINGKWVLNVRLNHDNGGDGYKGTQTFRELLIEDIDLKAGDVVKIYGIGNKGEFARIDKLEFCSEASDPMTAELGDRVWFDTNKDGIQNGGELGAADVTVLLKDADGNTLDQMTTDADGNYLFSGLKAGDYTVSVVAPGAYAFTGQNAGAEGADSDVDATGVSDVVTLAAGQSNLDVDAGLVDPGTASIAGRVFCDENGNDVDDAESAVDNVAVRLVNAAGTVVATVTTASDGSYSFTDLVAGNYTVQFDTNTLDGKILVAQNAGSDDTIDSDADASGTTDTISLAIGDNVTDVDAGVVEPNTAPEPMADIAKFCADKTPNINLLGNDEDADGDVLSVLSIADADELVFVGESLTLESGATATLNADGTVRYDANGVHDGLLVGALAVEETITYTVSDGNGATGSATLDITVCGTTSTLEMICDVLPDQVNLNIAFNGTQYRIDVVDDASTTVDDGMASATWEGFCIDLEGQLLLDQELTVNVYDLCGDIPDGLIQHPENLDQINWILNQEFIGKDNLDGSAQYDIYAVQQAVWALSDGTTTNNAGANEILGRAAAEGEGFVSGEGDLVAVLFDPIAPDASVTDTQTFILGVEWDVLALDCTCGANAMEII